MVLRFGRKGCSWKRDRVNDDGTRTIRRGSRSLCGGRAAGRGAGEARPASLDVRRLPVRVGATARGYGVAGSHGQRAETAAACATATTGGHRTGTTPGRGPANDNPQGMVGMAGMGGNGCGCYIRAVVVARKFCAEVRCGIGEFTRGREFPPTGRIAACCGTPP